MNVLNERRLQGLEDAVKRLTERIELVEKAAWIEHEDPTPEQLCEREGHRWQRVEYDLQGGKWGKDRCTRCKKEESWSV